MRPGREGSAELSGLDEARAGDGELPVEALALGVCGTHAEIVAGEYGEAPDGAARLVLGHESLGRVARAPAGGGFEKGDLVVGIVRRPDPEPCPCCARGEWGMCRNGRYRERGIKQLDGDGAKRFILEPAFALKLDAGLGPLGVLTEPTSVVAKAWEQIDRIAGRTCVPLERALVLGAGPIGLLAALLGAQRGLQVHVLDRVESGPKPDLTRALGASYHRGSVEDVCGEVGADVLVECTGAAELVVDAMANSAADAIVCLTGVSARGRRLTVDVGALNNELVLENDVVFGSVNANRRHFEAAAKALAAADPDWLEGLITRRVPWRTGGTRSNGARTTSRS